jgi:hypothetical protein
VQVIFGVGDDEDDEASKTLMRIRAVLFFFFFGWVDRTTTRGNVDAENDQIVGDKDRDNISKQVYYFKKGGGREIKEERVRKKAGPRQVQEDYFLERSLRKEKKLRSLFLREGCLRPE